MMKRFLLIGLISVVLTACGNTGSDDHGQEHDAHSSHGSEEPMTITTEWKFSSDSISANNKTDIAIAVKDDKGNAIKDFEIGHEKKMHLIVVSKDLSYFDHIHPEYHEDGTFTIATEFPSGGEYKLIADFIPEGASATTDIHWITVDGNSKGNEALIPDENMTKSVEGKTVTLSFEKQPQPGEEAVMKFSFKDEKSGKEINDLEQYLGAVGHVVVISDGAEDYLHNHPLEEKSTGPVAEFATTFPKAGLYKVWGQFQHKGKTFIVPYVVKVG